MPTVTRESSLGARVAQARQLIRPILTVIVVIAHPELGDATLRDTAEFRLTAITERASGQLVSSISTVCLEVTDPALWYAQSAITAELPGPTGPIFTVLLITVVTAVVNSITKSPIGDTTIVGGTRIPSNGTSNSLLMIQMTETVH